MQQLIECVPNFSEGNDLTIIKAITDAIESVEGVRLLDVDPGKATNRTVVTFVGSPEFVIEAAFRGIQKASELIDMSQHKGEHPRMGATDVCPLIPIAGISMEEVVVYAKKLAERVGNELTIPVYLYESAAQKSDRKNLATIRAGEYEGFAQKMQDPNWKPDFGPATFNVKAGATVIGARDFLVAYNVNLNTISERKANSVAFDVRENGRILREGDPVNGKIVTDEKGNPVRVPGTLKSVKAIGWYIEEYGVAQISMNLTDINVTPLHIAFDECSRRAEARGLRVTGSELVGMVPKKVLTDAGKYFLQKQGRSKGVSDEEAIFLAIKSLGLSELTPFDPSKKIIEYALEKPSDYPLVNKTLIAFANETSSEAPAPGGGSVSAYLGVLAASLGTMVANLSCVKKGWESKMDYFSDWAERGQALKNTLLKLVDEDTKAYNAILTAIRMPKETDAEKKLRSQAMADATKLAINVPIEVMKQSYATFDLIDEMTKQGNPNSMSDGCVAALCARSAVMGAAMNVRINCKDFDDTAFVQAALKIADAHEQSAKDKETAILAYFYEKMGV